MRTARPSLWRAPLQAIGMQQQQVKVFLSPLEPQEQAEGDTVTLVGQDGQPHLYEMLTVTSGGDVPAGIIYRPGGTSKDNVLATAKEVKQAIADTNGAIVVFVDASVAPTPGVALWPDTGTGASIGATDCLGTVEVRAYGNEGVPGPAGQVVLRIVDGASFKNLRKVGPGLSLQGQCTTTSALTFNASASFTLQGDSAGLPCILERLTGATVPMVEVSGSEVVLGFLTYAANVENDQAGAVGTFKVDANAALVWLAAQGLVVEATGPIVTSADNTATFEFITRDPETTMPAASTGWLTGFTGKEILTTDMASPQQQQWDTVWYQATDIYWDPANSSGTASDANPGLSSGLPLVTAAEIIRRFGGTNPILPYGQSLKIHMLSSQTLDADVLTLSPVLSGGATFSIIGTPTNRGAAFSPTTVSARVQTTAGAAFKLNGNLPAGLTVGDIINNTTQNGYAMVQAIAGGNASVSQPFAAAGLTTIANFPSLVEQNAWLNTDSYQALIPTSINVDLIQFPGSSASNPGGVYPTAWYQFLLFADASGTNGNSELVQDSLGPIVNFSLCTFGSSPVLDSADASQTALLSCGCLAACFLNASAQVAGGFVNGAAALQQGAFSQFHSNVILAGGVGVDGPLNFGQALLLATCTVTVTYGCSITIGAIGTGGGNLLYGPGAINVLASAACINASGGTWANCLKVATLQLDSVATGWNPPSEGTFTLNGVTQVDVAGVNGTNAFPATSCIALSLKTVGGTPGATAPYFSAAQAANAFHVKSGTANANDVYNWCALPASGITISSANLDVYRGLFNPATGARYAFK